MSRILKPDQTFAGSVRVRVYQPDPEPEEQPGADGCKDGSGIDDTGGYEAGSDGQDVSGKRYALISEEKRKILEHARKQAEQSAARILEEAYAQRDNIVNTARGEADRIHHKAMQEGYGQGLENALKDISQDLDSISGTVAVIGHEFETFKQHMDEKVAGLSFMIAEKILKKKVECDESELADMIEKAVLSERDKRNITIHIPADSTRLVEALEQRLEPLKDRMGGMLRIKTEARPAGFVQIETEEGIVDASLDVQLDNLKKQLMALTGQW